MTDDTIAYGAAILPPDHFIPQVAEQVVNAVRGLDDETLAITFACEAFMAEMWLTMHRN